MITFSIFSYKCFSSSSFSKDHSWKSCSKNFTIYSKVEYTFDNTSTFNPLGFDYLPFSFLNFESVQLITLHHCLLLL
ncbi:hypothetical protein PFBG_04237 [Plasmodium falciparum 7G8]|uniref:Uncharacterized protein n=1 Tax=Plasmodium falciparum (isolate 7G8) TaxID=57266 RepID=W7EX19_PLAF8|nr:hypothetical protein PFBG_04237 [Plasmodium falciparum 7G8]